MVINTTFNNISVLSWLSVLLVEETGVPEKINDLPQVTDKHYHIKLYGVHLHKSNYHTFTTPISGSQTHVSDDRHLFPR